MSPRRGLTPEERAGVLEHLAASRDRMLAAVESLTLEQWNFKPDADTWSAAECCEHVTLVESFVLRSVLEAPERTELPDVTGKEEIILQRVSVAFRKAAAPEPAQPKGRWPIEDLKEVFAGARRASIDLATGPDYPLRWKIVPHFALGALDGYQWLVFLGAHCDRHVRQLEAVKALAGFPRT